MSVSATEDGAKRLDAIEYHLRTVLPRCVLTISSPEDDGWRLTPCAVIIEAEQQLKLVNLDFDELGKSTRRRWWWSHLKKPKPKHGFSEQDNFAPAHKATATDQLLRRVLDLAVGTAQLGSFLSEDAKSEAAELALRLDAAGLRLLAQNVTKVAASPHKGQTNLLALTYILNNAISARRGLPYLRDQRPVADFER